MRPHRNARTLRPVVTAAWPAEGGPAADHQQTAADALHCAGDRLLVRHCQIVSQIVGQHDQRVFTEVPLFYPALVWVIVRGVWIGFKGSGSRARVFWPTWVLLAATVFLAGFRVGMNVEKSNVIDVGLSGVIGAERIVHGQAPWGNFPQDTINGRDLKICSKTDTEMRRQTNGACERTNPLGDTYGPTAYEAYIPAYLMTGWSGKWIQRCCRRMRPCYLAGFVAGTLAVFSVVFLEPNPLHEIATFWHRTIGYQLGRDAPWSLWDWRQYHARGLPDLHLVQRVLQVLLVAGAFAVSVWPRRKSPLQLVAFTAALLAGFEMVQTYWLYTYIPWFYPFAAIALLVPATGLRTLMARSGFDVDRLDPASGARDEDAPEPAAVPDGPEAER